MDVGNWVDIGILIFIFVGGLLFKRSMKKRDEDFIKAQNKMEKAQIRRDEEARENAALHIEGNILRDKIMIHNCHTNNLVISKIRGEKINGELKKSYEDGRILMEQVTEYHIRMTQRYSIKTAYNFNKK